MKGVSWECDPSEKPLRRLEFPELMRRELEGQFIRALMRKRLAYTFTGAEHEARDFLSGLEAFASLAPLYRAAPAEQKRREKLKAFSNAAENLLDAMLQVDDVALGHALMGGFSEVSDGYSREQHGQVSDALGDLIKTALITMWGQRPAVLDVSRPMLAQLNPHQLQRLAYDMKTVYAEHLKSFSLGVRASLKSMPPMDKDSYSFEYQTARFIEGHLGRLRLDVSTSDTGLAGSAFIATLELAGLKSPGAGYWLKKAKAAPDSWANVDNWPTEAM